MSDSDRRPSTWDLGRNLVDDYDQIIADPWKMCLADLVKIACPALRRAIAAEGANVGSLTAENLCLREMLAWAVGVIRCQVPRHQDYPDFRNAEALARDGPHMGGPFHQMTIRAELAEAKVDRLQSVVDDLAARVHAQSELAVPQIEIDRIRSGLVAIRDVILHTDQRVLGVMIDNLLESKVQ